VRRLKVARAAASKARDPQRRVDKLGGDVGSEAPDILSMQAVFSAGQRCLGHIYSRGRQGVEAFDADDRSLGLYPDQKSAADAVTRAAGGGS
jgi:hypothetical protein